MISISLVLMLLLLNFIGDFVLQSRYMAENKSKKIEVLIVHSLIYSLPFIALCIYTTLEITMNYMYANMILHAVIDGISSRLTAYFYKTENKYRFFVTIGLDQIVHMSILLSTAYYFIK